MVKIASYRLLQFAYRALPPDSMKNRVLKEVGGNAVRLQGHNNVYYPIFVCPVPELS